MSMTTTIPVRVYWEDTDGGGVVYYANYLKYLERARTEWLRERGFQQSRLAEELDVVFAVRRVEVDYKLPARLDDELEVSATVVEAGRSRVRFEQSIRCGGRTLIEARVEAACLTGSSFKPVRIPDVMMEALSA